MEPEAIKKLLEAKRDLLNELLFTSKHDEEMMIQPIKDLTILREYMIITITYFNAFERVEKDSEEYKVLAEFKTQFEPLANQILEKVKT